MTLELDDDERRTLADVLAEDVHELRGEITHTDERAFKARLQQREQVLERLLARLRGEPAGE